jgi:hypothetical protein
MPLFSLGEIGMGMGAHRAETGDLTVAARRTQRVAPDEARVMRTRSNGDHRRRKLTCESLEDRAVPATFGVPWSDPSHLTLSFAPDGTTIAGHSSTLFQALDAQEPTAVWEREVLLAFQTWAVNANINIGLVPDGGQAFGVAGGAQHDPRFGDIRVGAQAMAADALSISVPNDPAVSGTLTGDVLINSGDKFGDHGGLDVLGVLLHEAGHVFGIGDGTDPKSPMYPQYLGNSSLTAGDIASLQALYGTRSLDPHEGSSGNNTISTATTIQPPGSYTGATPLVAFGDISSNKDADVFAFKAPSGYKGSATIRLQSSGISLLAPHLSILDARGHVLGDAQAESDLGDVVTLHLGALDPNATYYLKVQGATSDVFGIGGYGLAVSFDAASQVASTAIDAVLRGPYQTLGPNDIASIFNSPSLTFFNSRHDDPGAVTTIAPTPGYAANSHYEVVGSISGPTDSVSYRIKTADAPSGGRPLVLTVTVRALDVNGTAPRVTILDGEGNTVAAQVLANGGGMFTVQAPNVKTGGNYVLSVGPATASGAASSGNFSLSAQFGTAAAQLSTLADDTLTTTAPTLSYNLYAGESQLMHLVLSAGDLGATASPGSAVQLTILDQAGAVIYTLTAPAGDVVSGPDLLLTPGAYTVRITALGGPDGPPPSLPFQLLGEEISDPIGPVINDPTLTPIYTAPGIPGWFLYPGDVTTPSPFLFVPTASA